MALPSSGRGFAAALLAVVGLVAGCAVDVRGKTAAEIAAAAAGAINAANATGFGIRATHAGATVTLTNVRNGRDGNTSIHVRPAGTPRLTADNLGRMVGGVGCPAYWDCDRPQDCLSGRCTQNRCE